MSRFLFKHICIYPSFKPKNLLKVDVSFLKNAYKKHKTRIHLKDFAAFLKSILFPVHYIGCVSKTYVGKCKFR